MNKTQVMALLRSHKDERGIEKRRASKPAGLKHFGIGLTTLRKLGKQIGRDHELALKLWESDVYDAKALALLIDDPKKITREQAESQVEKVDVGFLSHIFSSCDASLAKTPFVVELADDWINSKGLERRCCGYGLLYEVSKFTSKKAPENAHFLSHIARIKKSYLKEKPPVHMPMGVALMGIGKRNATLNAAALKVAKAIGPIENPSSGEHCEPLDVAKHLSTERLRKKLGIKPYRLPT
jgi:3-methyladenine DNA glycosylase AlkD